MLEKPTPVAGPDGKFSCPVRVALDLYSDKWTPLVLYMLRHEHKRYGQLQREAEGITSKMLTQTLVKLERLNLVSRHSYPEIPPRVEYALTPLGREAASHILNLVGWAVRHQTELLSQPGEGAAERPTDVSPPD